MLINVYIQIIAVYTHIHTESCKQIIFYVLINIQIIYYKRFVIKKTIVDIKIDLTARVFIIKIVMAKNLIL